MFFISHAMAFLFKNQYCFTNLWKFYHLFVYYHLFVKLLVVICECFQILLRFLELTNTTEPLLGIMVILALQFSMIFLQKKLITCMQLVSLLC